MSVDLDKLGVALRLPELQEHLAKEHTAMEKAAERMRDIIDPPYMRKMREQHEQLMAIVDPPYMRQMREMFDSTQMKTLADTFAGITSTIDPALFGGSISKNILSEWQSMEPPVDHLAGLKAYMPSESLSAMIAKSFVGHDAEMAALGRSSALFQTFEIPDYAQEFHQLSKISSAAEAMLATMDVSRGFADLLGVHDVTRSVIEYETGRVNLAYAGFSESIVNRPDWIASAPDFVRTAPADIVFSQARAVRVITTHEEVEEESAVSEIWSGVKERTLGYIEAVLPEVSPSLMKSWKGVWDAARRRGPDWARHAGSSLRFILIEVLDTVAPVQTLTDIPKQYYRDGKIMRPGQIYWLCVPLNNRTYRRVARADLESAISIIDAMSEAVHRDDYIEIEDAFDTMAVRASIALCNLLKLWKTRH
jgi:hypothetical protein